MMPAAFDMPEVEATLRSVLSDVLGLDRARVAEFDARTPLFGSMPELDSMAVASVLTGLEERFAITIDDDEVDAEMFETFGNLLTFINAKALA